MDNANIELIRGHMDTIILRTLMSGDKYGLEILNEIKEFSDELYSLKTSTLYNCLNRLKSQGLVLSYPGKSSNGAGRVYYKLTDAGREFVIDDQRQWEFSRTIIDKLISDKVFDPTLNEKPFDTTDLRPSTKRAPLIKETTNNDIDLNGGSNNDVNVECNSANDSACENCDNNSTALCEDNSSNVNNIEQSSATEQDKFYFSNSVEPNIEKQVTKRIAKDIPSAIDTLYSANLSNNGSSACDNINEHTKMSQNQADIHTYDIEPKVIDMQNDADKDNALSILYAQPKAQPTQEATSPQNNRQEAVDNFRGYNAKSTPAQPYADDHGLATAPLASQAERVEVPSNTNNLYQNFDNQNDKVESKTAVNYITSFDNIYNKNTPSEPNVDKIAPIVEPKVDDLYNYNTKDVAKSSKVVDTLSDDGDYEEMNFSKLKAKLRSENITLKQYVKSNTTNYYVNKYFYSGKLHRDWSLIIYAIYALFCIVSFCVARKYVACNLGVFLAVLFVGILLPIACFALWKLNPTARKATTFNLSHSMITGLIVMLGMLMLILLISFFGIQVNVSDTKSLIIPLIIPLTSLLLIPIGIIVYALLYRSKKYHLR